MGSSKTWLAAGIGMIVVVLALIVLIMTFGWNGDDKDEANPDNGTSTSQGSDSGTLTAENGTDFKVEYPTTEWMTNGGDYYNRRYANLDQITTENIKNLKPEWVTSLGSGTEFKYSGEATPVVIDGVMYVTTGANDVLALDAVTGEKVWEYRPEIAQEMDTVCCGWVNRGVGFGDGMIFTTLLDARLVALDQKTGEVVWEREVANWEEGYTITGAPLYYNGKVYTGVAGGEYGIRGRLTAFDADNGREIWRFYTIPGPGEKGHETWPEDNDAWMTGGGPIWQTPAVDPELGYLYFATGNTSPDLDGSNRAGDNLYANSIMAIDAETGEYKWHFQEVHHDIWDMDPANPVILYDVEMDGEMKKGIAQAGKTGWVYFLDRTTGEPLVGIEEKEVPQDDRQHTSPTQPYPVGDAFVPQEVTDEAVKEDLSDEFEGEYGKIFDPFWETPLVIKPSPQGGANWPPSAYNPDTEYFYVLGNDNYFSFTRSDEKFKEGDAYLGSVFAPVLEAPQRGTVTAIDVKTNKIAWQVDWDAIAYSGVLTTKGNLVFVGHNDGRIIAYDAKTGDQVWEYMTDAGANAPPISYEVDGVQYISILSAGNTLAGSKHGDKMYTFKLDGTFKDGNVTNAGKGTPSTDTPSTGGDDKDTASAETDKGMDVFKNNCLACHGEQGAGGHNGPNLQDSKTAEDLDKVVARIKEGGSSMPSFDGILSEEEINAVAKYVNEVLSPLGK